MDTSRLKNVVIILLLILNVILAAALFVVNAGGGEDVAAVVRRLEALGVSADESVFAVRHELYVYRAVRGADDERAVAEMFVGQSVPEEQTGGARAFTGPNGVASFSRGGEVHVSVYDCGIGSDTAASAADAAKRVAAYLVSGGFGGASVRGSDGGSDGVVTMTIKQTLDGAEIYNGVLTATLAGTSLEAGGRWLPSGASRLSDKARSPGGLAINFLSAARDEGSEIGVIKSMKYVYYLISQDDTSVFAAPACIISTDAGDWLVSAVDGTIIAKT